MEGEYRIDGHTGEIHAKRDVIAKITTMKKIPVKFGRVYGKFYLGKQPQLESLEGSPTWVSGDYQLKSEILTSLKGAPEYVQGVFRVGSPMLESLEYLPTQGSRSHLIMYTPTLPLLRLVNARRVQWGFYRQYNDIDDSGWIATRIMTKYLGKGKAVVLNCALELKKAGFVENARW